MATSPKTPKSPKSQSKASAAKAPARLSLKTLQAELGQIETRLKKASGKTQRQISSLKSEFERLANASHSHNAESRAVLTRHVDVLAQKLNAQMADNQRAVTEGLAHALSNPTIETLARAIDDANARLDNNDSVQGTAIAAINRHISDLALAVDARLSHEEKARMAAMAAMKQAQDSTETRLSRAIMDTDKRMMLRLSELEAQNATALTQMGDKVVDLAEDLNARAEDGEAIIKDRVNEIALSTQAELDRFKANLQRRFDAMEEQLRGTDGHLNRSVKSLTSRIEGLEYGLTSAPVSSVAETSQYPTAPSLINTINSDTAVPYEGNSGGDNSGVMQSNEKTPAAYAAPIEDAFSPDAPLAHTAPIAPPIPAVVNTAMAPNPYLPLDGAQTTMRAEPMPLTDVAASAEAVPYDPANYAAAQPSVDPYLQPAQLQADAEIPPYPNDTPVAYAPPVQTEPNNPQYAAPYATPADMLPLEETPLPYADPAYAETSAGQASGNPESMEAARPGGHKPKKAKKRKKVKTPREKSAGSTLLTPRNKRLGAVAAGLGIITLVASQTVLKPASNPALQDPFGEPLPVAEMGDQDPAAVISAGVQTVPSIGNYDDNKAPVLASNASAGTALERAAQSGDAVAQLQLGLSKLEMGETQDAIALIRLSAGQEQPAALYRLAKLYEAGQGVTANLETARTLTERAAKGGNRIAMHDLALYYAEGRGGAKADMTAAAHWFQEAAQRGVVDSQFNLGVLFDSGEGVPQKRDMAFYWYSVAAAQGDQTAAARVAILQTELPEAEVSKAAKQVAAFKPRQIDALANGIFKDMPWGNSGKTSSKASVDAKQAIAKTQTLLSGLGYDVGAPDGAVGPKTRSAIISFERANGLPETGRVNAGLINRLELAAGA